MSRLIIKQPAITEKATDLSHLGQYVFLVDKSATKPEIRKAIERIYQVHVTDVNTVIKKSRRTRFGQIFSRGKLVKKAIITVKTGEKIDVIPQ